MSSQAAADPRLVEGPVAGLANDALGCICKAQFQVLDGESETSRTTVPTCRNLQFTREERKGTGKQ